MCVAHVRALAVSHRRKVHDSSPPTRKLERAVHVPPGVGGSIPVVFTLGAELFATRIRGAMVSLIAR